MITPASDETTADTGYSGTLFAAHVSNSLRDRSRRREIARTIPAIRALIELGTPAGRSDPYTLYHRIMPYGPVILVPPHTWIVVWYTEASQALRDDRLSNDLANRSLRDGGLARKSDFEKHESMRIHDWMLLKDGADHARLKSLVAGPFSRRAIEELRVHVESVANALLDRCQAREQIDLIEDFASPIPMTVICDLLDIPGSDRKMFGIWTQKLARLLDPAVSSEENETILESGDEAWREFAAYFSELIRARRRELGDDLLSSLIVASDGADRLSMDELLAQATLLLVAGHETTTNLIGNGVLTLLRHPTEMQKLRRDYSLMRSTVEELLRFESPVASVMRVARDDLTIGGKSIPRGHDVVIAIGAANRDPRQFPDPDLLDLTRDDGPNLSFSSGPHYCLGASLARMEAEVSLTALLDRFGKIELGAEPPQWRETTTLRGLTSLPLIVSP